MTKPWEKLGDEILTRHLVFDVRCSRQRSPRTGVEVPFFLIDTANWVNIVPVTTEGEVDFVLELLKKHVVRLREMSPLWEMVQEGIDLKEIQWSQDEHH